MWGERNAVDPGARGRIEIGDPVAVGVRPKLGVPPRNVRVFGGQLNVGFVTPANNLSPLRKRPKPFLWRDVRHDQIRGGGHQAAFQSAAYGREFPYYPRSKWRVAKPMPASKSQAIGLGPLQYSQPSPMSTK
jgi:hypothetical protein